MIAGLDPPSAVVLAGAVVAGFVQGLSGFALALVASVFWSAALPPQLLAPVVTICSLAGQLQSIRTVLPALQPRIAFPMMAGTLLGIPIGVALLPHVDAHAFRLGVGILLCLYCPMAMLIRRLPRIAWGGRLADAAIGVLSGTMGGVAGLSGPPPILWCGLRGWPFAVQRATFQSVLMTAQAAGLLGYLVSGLVTTEVLRLTAWLLPCALVPSAIGTLLYTRMPGDLFRRLVLAVLLLSGIGMIAESLLG